VVNKKDHLNYMAPNDLLKNKVILVTGAGDGIGRSASICFAKFGATVILCGRTLNKLEYVYDKIVSSNGSKPAIFCMDMVTATVDGYRNLGNEIKHEFSRLDGLLNNAAILGQLGPLVQYDCSLWSEVMHVNVNATFMITRQLLPLLRLSETSSIIFTSSGVGKKAKSNWGAYAVSKFATEGMMQTFADDEDGISQVRINAIDPGAVATSMRAAAFPAEDPSRLRKPEDIMNTYLYLMGNDSVGISGESLNAQ